MPTFIHHRTVARRLAAGSSVSEVEQIAVRQAVHLTGGEAGAFVRHLDRRLSAGYETEPGLLVHDQLGHGIFDRVIGAGQEVMQVSTSEPAIRHLPVSLIAVPVFAGGAVAGAIVVVRSAARPFNESDRQLMGDMRPIVGAALDTAHNTERAEDEALRDGLTGVYNRRALDADLAALEDTEPVAVVMVDLDHFKAVNDAFGYQGGDDLLVSACDRMARCIRLSDRIYRYGGEEFCVIMANTSESTAATIANRIRVSLASSPFVIGDRLASHQASASFGVSAGVGGPTVLRDADQALNASKQSGRDRVTVASALVS